MKISKLEFEELFTVACKPQIETIKTLNLATFF